MSKLTKGKSLLAQNPKIIAAEPAHDTSAEQQKNETIRCTVTLGSMLDLTTKIANHIKNIQEMLPRGAIAPTPATVLREFIESKDQEISELFDQYLVDS
jgi:hypothetical protein